MIDNPVGLNGVAFVEFSGDKDYYDQLFTQYGFKKIASNTKNQVHLYRQGQINFLVNVDPNSYAYSFFLQHGPCVSGMGFRVQNADKALQVAEDRGATPIVTNRSLLPYPAIYGIGDAAVYLMDDQQLSSFYTEFLPVDESNQVIPGFGFSVVDHFTNNVPRGEMEKWCNYYKSVFNFQETRYFHIQGKLTGLESKVMRSPCGQFSIPINEPTETKSQIQEYLDEYKGSGVQHIALLTSNIVDTLKTLKSRDLQFLSAPPESYYKMLKTRLPNCDEEIAPLQQNGILVDGDEQGYLLQIFSKNIIGPIFFEVIERKNHHGFGEGNFQALFDSIEQDQRERGYL